MSFLKMGWIAFALLVSTSDFAEEASWKTFKTKIAVLHKTDRMPEAVQLAHDAVKNAEDEESAAHADLPRYLEMLAKLHTMLGHPTEAEPLYKRSLMIRKRTEGSKIADVAKTLGLLAAVYSAQAKYAQAAEALKEKLAFLEQIYGTDYSKLKKDKKLHELLVRKAKLQTYEKR